MQHLAQLYGDLTRIDPVDELAVSYQALALSIVIRIDAQKTHVLNFSADGDSYLQVVPVLEWWQSRGENYEPPWRADCGWLDSIGHGAELAGAVGQHPTLSAPVATKLATTVAQLAQIDRRFIASEDDRLALAFALVVAHIPRILDDLEPNALWRTALPKTPLEAGWEAKLNLHAFLCALASIWVFGVEVEEGDIHLPLRSRDAAESQWLRRAFAATDTSGLWGFQAV